MRRSLGAGLLVGAALGTAARRWWERRTRAGARGSLHLGLHRDPAEVGGALLQATGTPLVPGNRLAWRDDAEIFAALEEAVAGARHSVHLDVYIWKPGRVGARLAGLACRKARQGTAVRILVDPMGSGGFEEELSGPLRRAGCEVRYFRPPRRYPLALLGRNHRKLVVVDGRVGFTGGFGIADEWAEDRPGAPRWRDANAEVEGPAVRQMQLAFAAHWLETGGSLLPAAELERARPAGPARAAYVTSMDVQGLSHARWVTHIALMAARRRAWIANAYFVPPPQVLGALLLLPHRGVEVRLLLPGPHQDHASVAFLQRRLYPRLGRAGVEVHEYLPAMMHAKTMLVDDRLAVVGSINLDFLSMEWLEEGCLVVEDEPFAAALERRWATDVARARRVVGGPAAAPRPAPVAGEAAPRG